jgi:sulfite reductase alpha subunit-like flavoprotein
MTMRLAILYASQTGTAETYAKMLGTYAASHGVVPTVASMNDGVPLLAATPFDCTVFICATCGVGEVPTNGRAFFTAVEKGALNAASLGPCCILGFGNSHNDNFNQAAKRLDQLLHAQKATTRVLPLTLSCELTNGGHEASFRAWKHALWPALGVDASSVSRNFTATYHCTPVTVTDAPVTERHIVRPDFFQTTVAQQRLLTAPGYEPRQHLLAFDVDAATQVRVFGREVDIGVGATLRKRRRRRHLSGGTVPAKRPCRCELGCSAACCLQQDAKNEAPAGRSSSSRDRAAVAGAAGCAGTPRDAI